MTKLGKGDKSWQRVQQLLEALLDYALNDCDRISNLHVSWKDETSTELIVNATLEALRHLVKDKNGFKPTANTSDKQTKLYIGEVLTKYLGDRLKIFVDGRPKSATRGCPDWTFTLKLETRDKHENIKKLKHKWEANSKSTVTIEYNGPQNTSTPAADSEDSPQVSQTAAKSPQNTPTTKHPRVVGLQNIIDVPVWKGRDEILAELKAKLLHPQNPPKVLAIIGQGGIGKTSLAVKLMESVGVNLSGLALAADSPYDCALYFKVQEGTSFDDVAEFLLGEGLRIQTPELLKTADERIAKIIAGLAQTRFLFVLDNLEDILQPANDPGGAGETPATDNSGKILLEAHRAISPEWGKLINALVYQQHQSQTIVTSREVPADLADTRYEGAEPDSELVEIARLPGVSVQAGIEILQQRQLKDKLADLHWVSQRVDGHVFLLTQLASLGKNKPGYLRKHPEFVTKKAEPMLREQLARQSEAARDLLRRMCVLRVPIDIPGLTFLRLYTDDDYRFEMAAILEEPAELTEEEISETEAILERLVDSSLVQSRYSEEKCEVFYDLHRVIVEFLQVEYQAAMPKLLESVYKFYCTGKNVENPKTLDDLRPVLEAQHFAFMLGNYSESSNLLMWTLEQCLRTWGYWNFLKDLYEQILPHVDDDNRPVCLRQIGRTYSDFGYWDIAERYFKDALVIEQEEEDKSGIANSLSCLGYIERNRGNWDEAERLYRQCLEVDTELGDRSGMASSWGQLGDIERNRGNWDEAERLYRQSLELRTELGDRSGMATSIGCLGENELGRGNLDAAEPLLQEALAKMQELGMTWHIGETNYDLAQLYRQRNNPELAQQHYNTAHQIFQQLGAAKDLEKIEREWHNPDF